MTIGELKSILNALPKEINGVNIDDVELFTKNSFNPVGNIGELDQIEISSYGSWGTDIPCILLNTAYTIDKSGKMVDLECIDLNEEYGITLKYKGNTEEYKKNLALQRKIAECLYKQADDNDRFDGIVGKYYTTLIPGVLTEIDYSMLMKVLPEYLKRPVTREEFDQNRDQLIESIRSSLGITDSQEQNLKARK